MRQIIYFSTAAGRQDPATLAAILTAARGHNAPDKITGLLVAGGHRYLGLIEGPARLVDATIERIRRDDRHVAMTILIERRIARRSFPKWSMGFIEASPNNDFATLGDMVARVRAQVSEPRLRAQIDCLAATFVISPASLAPGDAPVASPWMLATSYDPGLAFDRSH